MFDYKDMNYEICRVGRQIRIGEIKCRGVKRRREKSCTEDLQGDTNVKRRKVIQNTNTKCMGEPAASVVAEVEDS